MLLNPSGGFGLIVALSVVACSSKPSGDAAPTVHPLGADWQRALPATATPQGLKSLRASECGTCHQEQLAEWRTSSHANAWTDPQFQAEWKKDGKLWLCVNCHAPLENQQPASATALLNGDVMRPVMTPNAAYDPLLRDEGIGCAACHVRDGTVLTARDPTTPAPHSLRVDTSALSASSCVRCHNARAEVSAALVCTFDTGDDWRGTELPGAGISCIDCHLPPAERPGGRRHDFLGAGIAKAAALPVRGRSGLTVELHPDENGYPAGKTSALKAVISNRLAGHSIPTGDVERWAEVQFNLVDDSGATVWTHVETFGEKWEWYPKARRLSDDSLPRNREREISLLIPVPATSRAAELEVVIINHRMKEETHAWAGLPSTYPTAAEAFRSRTRLLVTR